MIVPIYISTCIWCLRINLRWLISSLLPLHLFFKILCFVISFMALISGSLLILPNRIEFLSRYIVEFICWASHKPKCCHICALVGQSYNMCEIDSVVWQNSHKSSSLRSKSLSFFYLWWLSCELLESESKLFLHLICTFVRYYRYISSL